MTVCPCRSKDQEIINYDDCCRPFLEGGQKTPTAETLMRSRYSAYALKKIDYIVATQIEVSDDIFNTQEALNWANSCDWLGLEIKKTIKGTVDDKTGIVEFTAFLRDKSTEQEFFHNESSSFIKENDQWKFKDGLIQGKKPIIRLESKIGRNDVCSCGSGKKFKKCCGA
jgi:SEC-C motif-containing protein